MRTAGLLLLLCPAAVAAGEPFAATRAPVPVLSSPTVTMEVEPASWPFRPRPTPAPAPAPVPNCPPADRWYPLPPVPGVPLTPAVPGAPASPANPANPANPAAPNPSDVAGQNPGDAPNNAFAQGTEGGGASPRSFNDNFNGDFGGLTVCKRVVIGFAPAPTPRPPEIETFEEGVAVPPGQVPVYGKVCTVVGGRYSGILITDNDSPRPTDRAYFGYNYYNGLNPTRNPGYDRIDMHRETIGFEKTILDGDASIGMRLPFVQTTGPANDRSPGDLSILLKYAFYNDRGTGDLLSAGLVVTTPTGGNGDVYLIDGSVAPHSVLLQPWMGGVKMFDRWYAQYIGSYVIPTSNREPVLANNSVAAGWFLYRNAADRLVNAVVPVVELHLRNPLTFRSTDCPISIQDQLNITTGVHFRTDRATISPSITVPTMGPNPFRYEATVWFNLLF